MTLYETLGVAPDADDAALKTAHRLLVKEHHPDKHGGDDTQFKAIQAAYDVLKDPEKRAHYDRTGETDAMDPEAKKDRDARKFASELLELAVDTLEDVEHTDIIESCLDRIAGKADEIDGHIEKNRAADLRAEKMLKRLKRKAEVEEDVLKSVLIRKRERLEKEHVSMLVALDIIGRVQTIYEGYSYEFSRKGPTPMPYPTTPQAERQISPAEFDRIFGHLIEPSRRKPG